MYQKLVFHLTAHDLLHNYHIVLHGIEFSVYKNVSINLIILGPNEFCMKYVHLRHLVAKQKYCESNEIYFVTNI